MRKLKPKEGLSKVTLLTGRVGIRAYVFKP